MNLQDMFDLAVSKTIAQGKRCVNDDGECLYRHEGLACAIGQLINDDQEPERLSGSLARKKIREAVMASNPNHVFTHQDWDVLDDLQHAHDDTHERDFAQHFKHRAQRVALHYGLEWNHG